MSDPPHHWFHLSARGFELPVAIFDLDGVISDASHRQLFLSVDPPDWDGFYRAAASDPLIPEGRAELGRYRDDHLVVIVTARPVAIAASTLDWLEANDVAVDLVILRPDGDERSSPEVKRDELARLRAAGGDVQIAHDDDPRIIEMYEKGGVEARYIHSGYYDSGPTV